MEKQPARSQLLFLDATTMPTKFLCHMFSAVFRQVYIMGKPYADFAIAYFLRLEPAMLWTDTGNVNIFHLNAKMALHMCASSTVGGTIA